MKIEGKVTVVTGAASGIGRALARRFAREGARGVVVADVQRAALESVADEIGGLAVPCDVTDEGAVQALAAAAEERFGPIDVFCSNAGVARHGGEEAPDEEWRLSWDLHVMAHVYAARRVAPKMAARGSGYLVNTASAAGLLTHVESATYAATKHAAVAFAEYLAIAYGDRGCARVGALPAGGSYRDDRGAGAGGGERGRNDSNRMSSLTASWRRWTGKTFSSCPIPRFWSTCAARPRITTGGSAGCGASAATSRTASGAWRRMFVARHEAFHGAGPRPDGFPPTDPRRRRRRDGASPGIGASGEHPSPRSG